MGKKITKTPKDRGKLLGTIEVNHPTLWKLSP